MLARRFLWVVAGLVVLVLIGAIAYRIFAPDLMKKALVPTIAFEEMPKAPPKTYADAEMWIARPDIPGNPALWTPKGVSSEGEKKASVFFIHPTSYLERTHWNASIDDAESQQRARLFVQSQASAFNHVGEIWAPKYRQATFGAFLTTKEDAERALDFAYQDVLLAFETFLKEAPKNRPIILAAHSQGSLHLTRLLAERIAGKAEQARIAAAYVGGWPISIKTDLPELGLPGCETPDQSSCIVSWQSFAEPADPKMVTDVYDASTGLTGEARAGSPMLCVNPITGSPAEAGDAKANLGTLVPNEDLTDAELVAPGAPARCDIRGFLLIGENAPDLGAYVLPGNNYHVYDYALFWANIRADAERRLASFATP